MRHSHGIIALLLTTIACGETDRCIAAHWRVVDSPSGRRRATVFSGPCPGAAPQILLEFRRSGIGSGVFAVDDSVMQAQVRWAGEDTLEISYSTAARVSQQRTFIQGGNEHVVVRYAARDDKPAISTTPPNEH